MTAYCNDCKELTSWSAGRGARFKDHKCKCGSKNVSLVSARHNSENNTWDYYDRKQNMLKRVPCGTPTF